MEKEKDFEVLALELADMFGANILTSEVFDGFCDENNLSDGESNKLFDKLRGKHGLPPVPIWLV